jgi:glycosylphosphatidylinositol transamidase (GPIT) subunit GPI8
MDNQWSQQISYCLLGLHPHLTAISNWLSTSAVYIAYRHIGNYIYIYRQMKKTKFSATVVLQNYKNQR